MIDTEGAREGQVNGISIVEPATTRSGSRARVTARAAIGRGGSAASSARSSSVDRGVSRLPVVDEEGRLVGIVSRANLVSAFACSDEEIEREIEHDVIPGVFLWCSPGDVQTAVEKGDVVLTGTVESEDVARLLVSSVGHVLGVLSVRSELRVRGAMRVPD